MQYIESIKKQNKEEQEKIDAENEQEKYQKMIDRDPMNYKKKKDHKKPPLQKDFHRHVAKQMMSAPVPFAQNQGNQFISRNDDVKFKPKCSDINQFQ